MKLDVAGLPLTSRRPVRVPTDLRSASMSCRTFESIFYRTTLIVTHTSLGGRSIHA